MSLEYVSLKEVKDWMQIQHTASDDRIVFAIQAGSNAVKNYLGDFSAYEGQRNTDDDYILDSNYEPEIQLDANDEQVVKYEVRLAVIELIRVMIDNPDAFYSFQSMSMLPPQCEALLKPLRDPALR